jgi:drug/metabolite transporter (DMT)-like permease
MPSLSRLERFKTHAALLVVQLAFGSQVVEAKIVMLPRAAGGEAVASAAVAMIRMLGAAVFFLVFSRSTRQLAPTTGRERLQLAGLSILGVALNQALFMWGLRVTTPMAASLLGLIIPVVTAALAVVAGHERMTARTGIGLAIAAGGALWLTGVGPGSVVDRGALVVLMNGLLYSAYLVYSRRLVQKLGAVTVVTWAFGWGALLFAPLGLPALLGAGDWTARAWLFLAYILAVPTIVAYLANAWALGRSSATLVTVYIYVQPVFAALLAWLQLGHGISERLFVSAVLILLGVGIVASRK